MRSKTGTVIIVILCALVIASLACGGGGGGGEEEEFEEEEYEEEPEEAKEPPAEEEPEVEPPAEEEPEVEPPAAEEPEEELPAGAEPPEEPPPPDVKAHLRYTPGGAEGGVPLPNCGFAPVPPPGEWPAIVGYSGWLCLHGYPSATSLFVELESPRGDTYFAEFEIEPLEPGGGSEPVTQVYPTHKESVGSARADSDGLTEIYIQLGLTGLPSGQWTALVASESDGFSYETTFASDDGPAVSALREGLTDPFFDTFCGDFGPGEQVTILGTGFAPNDELPLAIYHTPAQTVLEVDRVDLVYAEMVYTGGAGEFWTAVTVEASDPPGTYYVVAITDPAADQFSVGRGPLPTGCFKVP